MSGRIFADVILPIAIPNLLTYEVPAELTTDVAVGKRVIVQLGKQKYYSGVVRKVHHQPPPFHDIKNIQSILDEEPIVNEQQFQLWEWIASYYLCHIGEVMNAALPSALKLHSETSVVLNPEYHHDHDNLSDKEFLIYEALLVRHQISLADAAKIIQRKSAISVLKTMIDKGVVLIEEKVEGRFKPKRETRISLAAQYDKEAELQSLFDVLENKSPKQLEALMAFISSPPAPQMGEQDFGLHPAMALGGKYVLKSDLLKHKSVSSSAVATLIKKKVLEENVVVVDRLITDDSSVVKPSALSAAQSKALKEIKENFLQHDAVLLHGVTSSGKTEIYTHLIEETINEGKQVLYLLPEIALTTQMINRLRKHFGSGVGVYHSRQNSNEKVELWNKIAAPPPPKGGSASSKAYSYNYETADPTLYGLLKKFVQEQRSVPTEAENIFWQLVRGKKLEGYKFRRQHIIGSYIADFVCLREKLIIEINGLIHQLPQIKENDEQRTKWSNEHGFKIIRFSNEEIIGNPDQTLTKVLNELQKQTAVGDSATVSPPLGGRGAVKIILGARSALFLPYSTIGLIIVDEEHDSSYKQNDPAPRYHARDIALVLARMYGAKTLLGSATPSLESFFNTREKKYGLVKLNERYGNMQLPEIIVCDTKEAERKKQMKSHFAPLMIETIGEALNNKEQVILFQNRRGFAPVLECRNCNWIPQCKNCSVTLTYHKQFNQLKCHYCGYAQNPPSVCQQCGDRHLEIKGYGTEKIEEEIAIFFPNAAIARLDLDAARARNAYQRIIGDFEDKKIDILVGTQMVTKGLDFENVSTVGIINADQMLNFPDFRAHERSYQLMSQVSGRSGRKLKRGRVIIQTQQPSHWVILDVVNHNYEAFFEQDLYERQKFSYPPLTRLIEITLKHKDNEYLHGASFEFADSLRANLGKRVIGPHQPMIARIRNLWQKRILVKIEREASPNRVKEIIRQTLELFYKDKKNQAVTIVVDVDPA